MRTLLFFSIFTACKVNSLKTGYETAEDLNFRTSLCEQTMTVRTGLHIFAFLRLFDSNNLRSAQVSHYLSTVR